VQKKVSENFADDDEFYENFNDQEKKVGPPIHRTRDRRDNIDCIDERSSRCLENDVAEESGEIPVQPPPQHKEGKNDEEGIGRDRQVVPQK
jgi:hypothetical protein